MRERYYHIFKISKQALLQCYSATSAVKLTITAEVMVWGGWPVVIYVKELTTVERP